MAGKIRIIFSVFALIMMIVFAIRAVTTGWPLTVWGMLAIAFVSCLLVFVRFVYIFNFSYAICALLNGLLILAVKPSAASALVAGTAALYGLRLLIFTWSRTRSESYAGRVRNIEQADDEMPGAAKGVLYATVTWLMTYHLMAAWYVADAATLSVGVIAGGVIMLAGTVLEAVADSQKQQAKAGHPDKPVTGGVYARLRHPNYLGEIGLQAGLMIAGLSVVTAPLDALIVVLAPLYITLLMIAEAQRVDQYQQSRYGEDDKWRAYFERSGSLLPR